MTSILSSAVSLPTPTSMGNNNTNRYPASAVAVLGDYVYVDGGEINRYVNTSFFDQYTSKSLPLIAPNSNRSLITSRQRYTVASPHGVMDECNSPVQRD